jgi:hypothetical protein
MDKIFKKSVKVIVIALIVILLQTDLDYFIEIIKTMFNF